MPNSDTFPQIRTQLTMKLTQILVAFSLFFNNYVSSSSFDTGICKSGRSQSPIDLVPSFVSKSDGIPQMNSRISALRYQAKSSGTFEMRCAEASGHCGTLTFSDKKVYELVELHLHSPSEHTFNGRRFPLELHFVHSDNSSSNAVYGVVFMEGKHNSELQRVLDAARYKGHTAVRIKKLSGAKKADRCILNGSLTTPPCTEGVRWVVSTKIGQASRQQIAEYSNIINGVENSRIVQPLYGRQVKCFRKIEDDTDSDSDNVTDD